MSAMNTVNISVTLDTNANPPVVVSNRNQQATSGDTIRWQKADNNDSFDIVSLSPTGEGEAFSTANTGGNGQWLTSTYQPPDTSAGKEYPYTLTVTSGGKSYNTTQTVTTKTEDTSANVAFSVSGGKPVIRN